MSKQKLRNVRVSFMSRVKYYKDVKMTDAKFDEMCARIDAKEVDAEDLFAEYGLHIVDDANYDDVELDDFYIDEPSI